MSEVVRSPTNVRHTGALYLDPTALAKNSQKKGARRKEVEEDFSTRRMSVRGMDFSTFPTHSNSGLMLARRSPRKNHDEGDLFVLITIVLLGI
jgi:hypothetical protein